MLRRGGRPGLMGTMARTAVVAGTATAVSGNVRRRQAGRDQATEPEPPQQEEAPLPDSSQNGQSAGVMPEPAGESRGDDLSSQIERLSTLKTAGVISEVEFTAAKARLLGI